MKHLLLFLLPLSIFAQQPSHYVLGARELQGVDIYDMLHASNGDHLLATTNGVIRFDGYRFRQVGCQDMIMSSVFNLVEDANGNIYCNNLSGQVFRIDGNGCQPLLLLPDSLLSPDYDLAVDDQNRLIISGDKLLALEPNGQLTVLAEPDLSGMIERLPDGRLISRSDSLGYLLSIANGKVRYDVPSKLVTNGIELPNAIYFNDTLYSFFANSCKIYRLGREEQGPIIDPSQTAGATHLFRLYATSNSLWFASNTLGVLRFDKHFRPTHNGNMIFGQTLISDVLEDRDGNVLLGTFGKGIYVIPNESTEELLLAGYDEQVISVSRSAEGKLYFGTRAGKIFERKDDGAIRLVRNSKVKSVEALFVLDPNTLLIGEADGLIIDLKNQNEVGLAIGSLKDVDQVSDTEFLLGTNTGAYLLDLTTKKLKGISGTNFRHFCLTYDPITGSIYSGTSKGLRLRQKNGAITNVQYQGKDVIARDFLSAHGNVYIATSDKGLLIYKNDTLADVWSTNKGLLSDRLIKLGVFNDKLVVASSEGIQLVDLEGNVLRTITQADGLNTTQIIDFDVNHDELWVVHSLGVQKIMLQASKQFDYQPTLKLKSVLLNDSVMVAADKHNFRPNEQKFTFEMSASSLRYNNEIRYKYRLEGAEPSWQHASFSNNIIEYRSLSPGSYTFRAVAICRGRESEEVSYAFTIATPFYKAWWFFLINSLLIVLVFALWFRSRLKRQQLLADQQNELNASKLTAIQSQMNPHFIFNALNSIQDLVLKGDVTNSYTYITKFADLVRRTLNYSDKDFIDFESELKLIQLYLTLEKLRFRTDFNFVIEADNIDDIQVPPMLIQPFIENALVHGLLHREGAKRLELRFELKENLHCTITDNGVGRKKAKEIKIRQRSDHESFSVNAIKRRFEILDRNFGGNLGFKTIDLMDGEEAIGTQVRLIIPVKHKF